MDEFDGMNRKRNEVNQTRLFCYKFIIPIDSKDIDENPIYIKYTYYVCHDSIFLAIPPHYLCSKCSIQQTSHSEKKLSVEHTLDMIHSSRASRHTVNEAVHFIELTFCG